VLQRRRIPLPKALRGNPSLTASRRRLPAARCRLDLLLLLDVLQYGTEALVRDDVGLLDLPDLVENAVGQVGAFVVDGDGSVRVVVDTDLLAPQPDGGLPNSSGSGRVF
jgi:hypothetical protein